MSHQKLHSVFLSFLHIFKINKYALGVRTPPWMWYQHYHQTHQVQLMTLSSCAILFWTVLFPFSATRKDVAFFQQNLMGLGTPKSEISQILSISGKHWAPRVTGSLWDSQLGHKTEWKEQGHWLPGSQSWHPGGRIVPCKNSTHDLGALSFSILIQPCVSFVSSHNSLDFPRGLFVTPIHLSFFVLSDKCFCCASPAQPLFQCKPWLWRPGWFTALFSIPLLSHSTLPACSITEL